MNSPSNSPSNPSGCYIQTISIPVSQQGLVEITSEIQSVVGSLSLKQGLCSIFARHTSCSLLIQENADPSAKRDLEYWLNRLVPERDPLYTHTYEGDDDMPAHIKAALTATQLSVPIEDGKLMLGTWQGIFLWEHRHQAGSRQVVLHIL